MATTKRTKRAVVKKRQDTERSPVAKRPKKETPKALTMLSGEQPHLTIDASAFTLPTMGNAEASALYGNIVKSLERALSQFSEDTSTRLLSFLSMIASPAHNAFVSQIPYDAAVYKTLAALTKQRDLLIFQPKAFPREYIMAVGQLRQAVELHIRAFRGMLN